MQPNGNAAPVHALPAPGQGLAGGLIAAVAAAAGAILAVYAPAAATAIADRPVEFVGFLAAAVFLQLRIIQVPEQGAVSFASIGMLGAAFSLGIGCGMIVGAAAAATRAVVARGRLDRAIFDAGNLALATATAAAVLHAASALDTRADDRFGPAVFGGLFFFVVNTGLLAAGMGLVEERSPWRIWKERLRWLAPYALAGSAYAELAVVVYDRIGVVGIVALAIAPAALVTPIRRHMFWSS